MKCMRILTGNMELKPYAHFQSSTRNMAFGSGSRTRPSTSIASSLAILYYLYSRLKIYNQFQLSVNLIQFYLKKSLARYQ